MTCLTDGEKRSVRAWLRERLSEMRIDEEFIRDEEPNLLPGLRKLLKQLGGIQ